MFRLRDIFAFLAKFLPQQGFATWLILVGAILCKHTEGNQPNLIDTLVWGVLEKTVISAGKKMGGFEFAFLAQQLAPPASTPSLDATPG